MIERPQIAEEIVGDQDSECGNIVTGTCCEPRGVLRKRGMKEEVGRLDSPWIKSAKSVRRCCPAEPLEALLVPAAEFLFSWHRHPLRIIRCFRMHGGVAASSHVSSLLACSEAFAAVTSRSYLLLLHEAPEKPAGDFSQQIRRTCYKKDEYA